MQSIRIQTQQFTSFKHIFVIISAHKKIIRMVRGTDVQLLLISNSITLTIH